MKRIGVLTTYPPTHCGIATFSSALTPPLAENGIEVGVVQIVDRPLDKPRPDVTAQLVRGVPRSIEVAAAALDRFDVAFVHHEYGLYDGPDGESVIDLLEAIRVPTLVILHTVLARPTPRRREILEAIAKLAGRLTVLSNAAEQQLHAAYDVDLSRVSVVPHGVELNLDGTVGHPDRVPTILTWGLLRPGKGIERALDAVSSLSDLRPPPRYHVAGEIHPTFAAGDGGRYYEQLRKRASELGIDDRVVFDPHYHPTEELRDIVRRCEVVLLPYDTTEQVSSGVLVDALAAGRPVVATRFPHAVELLSGGAGFVVDHEDTLAMSQALRRVLTDGDLAAGMSAEAVRLTRMFAWPSVAARYRSLAARLVREAAERG